jgi:hypothetical protein
MEFIEKQIQFSFRSVTNVSISYQTIIMETFSLDNFFKIISIGFKFYCVVNIVTFTIF